MDSSSQRSPSPARSAAGKANRARRGPLTAEGRQALRQAALRNKPWLASTGPRTAEGRKQAARNGKVRQKGAMSVRELQASLAGEVGVLDELRRARRLVAGLLASEGG